MTNQNLSPKRTLAFALLPALLCAFVPSCKSSSKPKSEAPSTQVDEAAEPADAPPTATSGTLDLYGDPLPAEAQGRLGSMRMLDRSIRQMQFNAEGTKVISTHKDGYQIWDLSDASREQILKLEAPGELMAVSPNGKLLATNIEGTGKVVLWDLSTGQKSATLAGKHQLAGICFVNDSQLVTATADTVTTWELSGKEASASSYQGGWSEATALACSPEAGWVGLGTDEGAAYLMQPGGGSHIALGSAEKKIRAVAIASDASAFAFASEDEHIYIWHTPAAGTSVKIEAHTRFVSDVAFSPDNKKLYSTGGDWWFRQWHPKKGELLEELPGAAGLEAQFMALSPDGNLMVSWSQHANERGSEAGRWWLWNATTGALLLEPARHRNALTSIAYSPDGSTLATASEDHSVRIWETKTTRSLKLLDGADGPITDLAYSADGQQIFSAGSDALVRRWHWNSDKSSNAVQAVGGAVNRVLVSPDGSTAFTGDQIGRVWSWDLATGNKIQALDRQGYSAIYDIALSPDASLLAIAGSAQVVRIINLNGGQELAQLNPGNTNANYAVEFSADGKFLATAGDGHKIQIWNTEDWSRSSTLEGHDGTVRCLAYSPDGTRLISGGNDELIRVWDTATGSEVANMPGHSDVISAVAVAPDGKSFASASRDRTALLWRMP